MNGPRTRPPWGRFGARQARGCLVWLVAALYTAAPDLQAQQPGSGESLQTYKQKVLAMMAKEADPGTRRELQRLYQLLSLMEKSMADQDAVLPRPDSEPPAVPEATVPQSSEPPLPQPKTEPKAAEKSTRSLADETDSQDSSVGDVSDKEAKPLAVPVDLAKDVPPAVPPAWHFRAGLTAAFGYQENLLRSAFSHLESSALLGQIDLELFKIRRETHRFFAFGRYNRTHFLDEPEVRDEDLLFVLAQYEKRISDTWWLGLRGDYLRAHQPIDDFEGVDRLGLSLPLSLEQISLGPLLTREWDEVHEWNVSAGFRREEVGAIVGFEDQSSDQLWLESQYTFEPNERHRWRMGYLLTHRDYDERAQRFPDGRLIEGSRSAVFSHRLFLEHRWTWRWKKARWRWTNGLRLVHEDGNGPGYEDVDRIEVRSRIEARFPRWEWLAEIRRGHDTYDARQVSVLDRSEVTREYWIGRVEGSYHLGDDWRFWLRYEGADRSGNREIDRYRYQSVYAGFQWSF